MWHSFKEDRYPNGDTPQHLMTAQNVAENGATSAQMGMLTTMFWKVMESFGVPRSASFLVENKAPEIIWDALCDVRKAGDVDSLGIAFPTYRWSMPSRGEKRPTGICQLACLLDGAGDGIRTREYWLGKPGPYHLATPASCERF